jgi:predicted unusual protein kinase regulating ubiquinone biosynthesis (AarF/ABC1/UbiB family)
MEIFKILCISLYEGGKYIVTGKFDYESFWYKCIRVNIIYTKFFQAIAINNVVHNIPYIEDEIMYPSVPFSKIVGSGLISIIFEGTVDGKTVIIKTKRKNIENRVCNSLYSIYKVLSVLNWFYSIPSLTIAYHEIKDIFLTQLDFCQEGENHTKFKSLFINHPSINIPTLIECTKDQIIMTKVEGVLLNSLSYDQKQRCIGHLTDLIIHSLFKGFIHGDLHAGNILFDVNSIGIIDFGFMIQLTTKERDLFVDIFKSFVLLEFQKAAIQTMEFVEPKSILDSLSPDIRIDIQHFIIHTYKVATQVNHCFSAYDMVEITNKLTPHGLCLSPLFSKMAISLHSVESVLAALSASPSDVMIHTVLSMVSDKLD